MNRRDFLRTTAGAAVAAAAPMISLGRVRLSAQSAAEYSTHAVDLVTSSLVIDMLHQIVYRIDQRDVLKRWLYQPGGFTDADFDQYRRSGISAINFGNGAATYEAGIQLFGEFNGFIAGYPDWLMRIGRSTDFERAKSTGRLGILFGLQNSTHFRTPDDVNTYGGKAGLYFPLNPNAYFGLGIIYERIESCDPAVYRDCSQTYPEGSLHFLF